MKSHHLSTYARIALTAAVTGVMTACASAPPYYDPGPYYSARVVYYDYWYYPAIGAYYDPRAHIYIYYEHDHWIRARALPPRIRPYLGHHVIVRSPHDRPYEEHHRHRQRHQPARYRERDRDQRGEDAWLGAPHQQSPQHDHDDRRIRRIESHDRERLGTDRGHEPEHGTVPVPPRYHEADTKYPRHAPDRRPKDTPRDREPPASTAPILREDTRRQPEIRSEDAREQYPSGDVRRDNERMKDRDRSGASTGQPGRYRAPASRRQPPKAPPQAAPVHREPPTRTVPAKRDDRGHQQEKRKEETVHRYRERDDRRDDIDKDEDAASQKRQRRQFDPYEPYR